jgi:chaperonin GroEL
MLKVKTQTKIFITDQKKLQKLVTETVDEIADIVGSSLGPGGRSVLIESELAGMPNKNTKDGVSIFRALGHSNPYKHVIIEQVRDAAVKTVNEAGDGTTTATVTAAAFIKNLFSFCNNHRQYSPQKVARRISQITKEELVPAIKAASIKANTAKTKHLLEKVATISANGDKEMSKAVMEAFELVGFGSASHVTIQELSGPSGYQVDLVEGFPISMGYEESIGKFHPMFINDQAHQRCTLDDPRFILFDGKITDPVQIADILARVGEQWATGQSEVRNIVIMAHNFGDQVLNWLALNFLNPETLNVVPLATPMSQIINSQLAFLQDVSAFTGATIFGMTNPLSDGTVEDLGANIEKIDVYRFRTTIVGEPESINIETRADQLRQQIKQADSKIEKILIEERLGKLTSGIAQLKIFGASSGELKEKADRAEDAVCAVRATINHGCLPGGCRIFVNLALDLQEKYPDDLIISEVLVPSLFASFTKLIMNAGFNAQEFEEILSKYVDDRKVVYDVESQQFGDPMKLGIFDATLAVEQSLTNAVSIASVMGTMGGLIVSPRDGNLELTEHREQSEFERTINNAEALSNAANERF